MPIDTNQYPPSATSIGIIWYRTPEDFHRLRAMFEDRSIFTNSYDAWLAEVSQSWDILKEQGYRVVKAYLDPEAFPDWCLEHNLKLNRESRTMYAAWYTKVTDTQFRAFQQPSDLN